MKCGKGPLKGKQLEIVVTDHDGGIVVKMMVVLMRKKGSLNSDLLFATTLPQFLASPVCLRSHYVRPFRFTLEIKQEKHLGGRNGKPWCFMYFKRQHLKQGADRG